MAHYTSAAPQAFILSQNLTGGTALFILRGTGDGCWAPPRKYSLDLRRRTCATLITWNGLETWGKELPSIFASAFIQSKIKHTYFINNILEHHQLNSFAVFDVLFALFIYLLIQTLLKEKKVSYFKRLRPISNKDSSVPVLTGGSWSLEANVAQAM